MVGLVVLKSRKPKKEQQMSFLLKKLDSLSTEEKSAKEKENSMLVNDPNNVSGTSSTSSSTSGQQTLIGVDCSFKGSIDFKNSLRIDGKFEGSIESEGTLIVGKSGVVKAEIKVGDVVIEGKIHGNVVAKNKVDLRSTAELLGDVQANKLVIAEGVSFVGNCDVNPNNEKVSQEASTQSKPVNPSSKPQNQGHTNSSNHKKTVK